MNTKTRAIVLGFLAFIASAVSAGDAPKPVAVFILAGQSNMEGQAVVDLDGKNYNDGKGTLKALMNEPSKAPLFKHLKNEKGEWSVRKDVWVRYQREKQPLLAGPLSIGFSIYGGKHHFGPELQFGHVVGDHVRSQVLLVKTAWGGKSLYKDFRPPSSGGEVGPYYKKMLAEVRQALESLKTDFPDYKGQGHQLAGLVWYQGWNDGVDPKNAVPQYEENLVNLVKDVRKDLDAPKLPVVIGELTGPWVDAPGAWATLRKAQANAANRPEFKGNVIFVETRHFVRLPKDSPNPGHGHHEFGNAETYFLVGDALGKGMVKLLAVQPKKDSDASVPELLKRKVSPEGAAYLQQLLKRTPFGTNDFNLKALRAGMGSRREPTIKNVKLIKVKIGAIPGEWVLAPGADPDVRLLYLHGGGFVSGTGGYYLRQAAHISAAAKCAILLPDYRLAPEHPFPAGLDDCVAAHEWMIANGPAGAAPSRATFIAGDSAGGGLTLSTLLALRDRKMTLPAGGIPISPCTDFTLASASLKTVHDPIISAKTMPLFRDHYLGKTDPRDPLASPVFGDYRGLPPLLIQVGEHEMLRDDSIRAAKKARADGIKVTLEVWPGMFHVFHSHEPLLPEARAAIGHIGEFVRSSLPRA